MNEMSHLSSSFILRQSLTRCFPHDWFGSQGKLGWLQNYVLVQVPRSGYAQVTGHSRRLLWVRQKTQQGKCRIHGIVGAVLHVAPDETDEVLALVPDEPLKARKWAHLDCLSR